MRALKADEELKRMFGSKVVEEEAGDADDGGEPVEGGKGCGGAGCGGNGARAANAAGCWS